ncbi:hypothetical protein WICMUC_000271 [Wickerhamomyces mucosus]|uniref:Ion transport domain-containing protein n=1 Tax=Wickerhamomyces mucosus TaxID=1378264 RepID=A0A9P8Q0B1_9ASCO|nr:hypothetical protein WICMUC_000271 [Wickerhamomyces mucosus]
MTDLEFDQTLAAEPGVTESFPFNETEEDSFLHDLTPSPRQVLRICLNLKLLIDNVIPIQFKWEDVISSDSKIINHRVIDLALQAAGGEGNGKIGSSSQKYRSSLVFALLKVTGWYWELAGTEIHDSDLYNLRAEAAQLIAKTVIEREKDHKFLFHMLTHRFVVNLNTIDSEPANALELAVDMHSTTIIGSSGYQRCVKWLWNGLIVQSAKNPSCYVFYKDVAKNSLLTHFNPNRIKTPLYQNYLEIFFSVVYLLLYTIYINQNEKGVVPLILPEIGYYLFTFSYIYDETVKLYHIGINNSYFNFWNIYNDFMYGIISVAIILRFVALHKVSSDPDFALTLDLASFRLLALTAPLMWCRMLLFLDVERFVGVLIVIIKVMMKESFIFFFLLTIVIVGFLQGFLGLDSSDGKRNSTYLIVTELMKGILGGANYSAFQQFSYPYSSILFYAYNFLISVILLNVLIALFSSAYQKVYDNALEEYMVLYTTRVLKYIRAPDSQVYVPPLNLIELIISPFQLILTKLQYNVLSYYVMIIIYSPFLCYISIKETIQARKISYNRLKGLSDDANEYDREWDLTDGYRDSDYLNGLFSDGNEGVQISNRHISQDLKDQYRAENEDPTFKVGKNWYNKVNTVSQPIDQSNEHGIGWELYPLYEKIDNLTKLVENLKEKENN